MEADRWRIVERISQKIWRDIYFVAINFLLNQTLGICVQISSNFAAQSFCQFKPISMYTLPAHSIFLYIGFILVFFIWIWALADCGERNLSDDDLILWMLVIVLFPIFGTIAYIIVGRTGSIQKYVEQTQAIFSIQLTFLHHIKPLITI